MAKATRTLNPLPLQDLEPHRFEDLVRQLAYDFRYWKSLEATGRAGSDEGMDIVGLERVPEDLDVEEAVASNGDADNDGDRESADEPGAERTRLWVFQCKREKSIGPTQVKNILNDYFKGKTETPYGYVLAAACDLSLKARTAFRDVLAARGVMEFYMWGKGELEDMLVLPKNDHLLFAYFGISLRVRRASARTLVRGRLALKRRLAKALGGIRSEGHEIVLIKDPSDDGYPFIRDRDSFLKAPRWRYWEFSKQEPPDHLMFVTRRMYAYANWETGEWDWIKGSLQNGATSHRSVHGLGNADVIRDEQQDIYEAYWEVKIPEQNRAWLIELRTIHYDRILAYDELGDSYNEGPHLLVDYRDGDPFDAGAYGSVTSAGQFYSPQTVLPTGPDDPKRVRIFPQEFPDLREELSAERKRRYEELMKQSENRRR